MPLFNEPSPQVSTRKTETMLRFLATWLFIEVFLLLAIVMVASILELLPKPALEAAAVLVSVLIVSATVVVFLLLIQELRTHRPQ